MRAVFLDAATLGDDITLSAVAALAETTVWPLSAPETIAERLAKVEIAIVNKVRMNEETLAGADRLRLICVAATGYDNIDLAYCRRRGIAVCNVVGYSTESVAQLTAAMVLTLLLHLPAYTEYVRSGAYTASGVANRLIPPFCELAGKTWGVVGAGHIGSRVARIADAFGCRVLVCRRKPDPMWETADIDTLCRTSDVVTVHTPLSEETRGLISRARVAEMKPSAILVNTARGAVLDEAAVADAVREGKLGGFGTDVYSAEPLPASHPLYALRAHPNVCLTPHMAWGAREARQRCIDEIAENIRDFARGGRRCRVD